MSCSFRSESFGGQYVRHQVYRARLSEMVDEQSRKDASFFNRPGLVGGPGYVSFEAEHFPAHFLRVRGGTEIWLDRHDGSEQFSREATFRLVPGLGNPMGVSIESLAFPGYFWRVQSMTLNLFPLASDQSEYARRDMTWHIEGAGITAAMAGPVPTSTAWAPAPPAGMSGGPFHGPGGTYPPSGPPPGASLVPSAMGGVPMGAAMPLPSGPGGMAYGYPGAAPAPGTPGSFPAAIGSTIQVFSLNFPSYDLRHQQYRLKISEPTDEQAKKDSEFRLQPSIAGAGGYFSLESTNFPGHFVHIRPGANEVWLDRYDGNPQFAREASFKLVPGLGNPSSYWSFESLAFPNCFLRHMSGVCFVHPNDGNPVLRQDATWNVRQIGLSPAGYGAPGAPAGSYAGAVPGFAPAGSPYGQAPLPQQPAPGYYGGPTAPGATTAFPGQPAGMMPSGSTMAPTPYYMGAPMVPVAGGAGTSQIPGMPQVISQGGGGGMMPGGYPGAPGAMAGYATAYPGGMAPPPMPVGAYNPAMMGSGPAAPGMAGSGQAGMYMPRPY